MGSQKTLLIFTPVKMYFSSVSLLRPITALTGFSALQLAGKLFTPAVDGIPVAPVSAFSISED
jgi:hypothetical protein